MKLTLIRHAESQFNTGENRTDRNVDLTEKGIEQAKNLSTSDEYDLMIVSPLRRALRTCSLSSLKYKRIDRNKEFREYKDSHLSNYFEGEKLVRENKSEFKKRVEGCLEYLYSLKDNYEKVCVVGHWCLFLMMTRILGDPIQFENCEVREIEI